MMRVTKCAVMRGVSRNTLIVFSLHLQKIPPRSQSSSEAKGPGADGPFCRGVKRSDIVGGGCRAPGTRKAKMNVIGANEMD